MAALRWGLLVLLATPAFAYYVPGTYPQEFAPGTVLQGASVAVARGAAGPGRRRPRPEIGSWGVQPGARR